MKTITLAFAAMVASLALAGAAHARDIAVSARGVDFASAAAVDAFHRDLAEAAKDACHGEGGRGLAGLKAERACRRAALDGAVADLDRQVLTALNAMLDARLRINPARPAMSAAALAALEADVRQQRAETPPANITR